MQYLAYQSEAKLFNDPDIPPLKQTLDEVLHELFTSTRSIKNIELYERLGYVRFDEKIITDEMRFVYLEKM